MFITYAFYLFSKGASIPIKWVSNSEALDRWPKSLSFFDKNPNLPGINITLIFFMKFCNKFGVISYM